MTSTDPPLAPRRFLLGAGVLVVLAAAVYANACRGQFFFDNHYILSDYRLRHAAEIPNILLKDYWYGVSPSRLWRPLTTLSYFVNYTVLGSGSDPFTYHAVNIALHAACATLVLALLLRLGSRPPCALFGAAVFACHPIATEAVTNIVGRADLLATAFVLASLLAARRGWILAQILYLLGLLAKENAVIAPALLVVLAWATPPLLGEAPVRASRARFLLRKVAPYAATAAIYLAARAWVLRGLDDHVAREANFLVSLPWLSRKLTAIKVVGLQVWLLLFPRTLSGDYAFDQIPAVRSALDPLLILGGLAIGGTLLLALRGRHLAGGLIAGGALFFLVALLPTSNLLLTIGTIMGERLLYLPSVGLGLVLAGLLEPLRRRSLVAAAIAAALAVVALGLRAHARNPDWNDARTFWAKTVETSPRSVRALRTYARLLMASDWRSLDAPIALLERAVAIDEDDVESRASLAFARAARARIDLHDQRIADADLDLDAARDQIRRARLVEELERAQSPDAERSAHLERADAVLAVAEADQRSARGEQAADRFQEAERHYRRAVALDPTNVPFQRELAGFLLRRSTDDRAALVMLLASLLLMPEQDAAYRELLAGACQRAGIRPGLLIEDGAGAPVARGLADVPPAERSRLESLWRAAIASAIEILGSGGHGDWVQQVRESAADLGIGP